MYTSNNNIQKKIQQQAYIFFHFENYNFLYIMVFFQIKTKNIHLIRKNVWNKMGLSKVLSTFVYV